MLGGTVVGSAGGFTGSIIPEIGFTLIAPAPLINSRRWLTIHRRIMKDVIKTVLWEWHEKILSGHFVPAAKSKYGHTPRRETTLRIKNARYHHVTDLVQTGKTARSMQSRIPRVTFEGTGDRFLQGVMKYRFPFPVSRDAKDPRHITMAKMGKEIATWTLAEMQWAIDRVAELYAKETEHYLSKSPKLQLQAQQKRFSF